MRSCTMKAAHTCVCLRPCEAVLLLFYPGRLPCCYYIWEAALLWSYPGRTSVSPCTKWIPVSPFTRWMSVPFFFAKHTCIPPAHTTITYRHCHTQENHHLAASLTALLDPQLNFLPPKGRSQLTRELRDSVIAMVLATDMRQHIRWAPHFCFGVGRALGCLLRTLHPGIYCNMPYHAYARTCAYVCTCAGA